MARPDNGPSRLREVIAYFGALGVIGFGGPNAHIAMMQRDAVERRGWLSGERFLHALAATNLVPGPNSTEMAIHLGYLRAGAAGAIFGGLAFILPAFVMMLGLSWLYFENATTPAVADLFYGVQPVVVALLVVTAYRLFLTGVGEPKRFLGRQGDWHLALIFAASLALVVAFPGYEIAVLIGAGVIGFLLYGPALRLTSPSLALVPLLGVSAFAWEPGTLLDLFWLCLRTGGLLFGGGYVMIPLLEDPVVGHFGWLTREQFLAGVAVGQTTPGPIVITATFVGYGAAGLAGAAVATFAIFLPSFFFAVLTSRFIAAFGEVAWLRAALKGIGAAVVGTLFAVSVRLGESAFVDAATVAVGIAAALALLRFRLHGALLVAIGGAAGLAIGAPT